MVTGYPTTLETLLAAVSGLYSATSAPVGVDPTSVTALSGKLPLFPAERVYVTLVPDAMFAADPPCDQFLIIRPHIFPAITDLYNGGGNFFIGTDGTIDLTLWSRFEADTPLTDASALSDATYGILGLWRRCLAILSQFMPTDGSGRGLALEPIRFLQWETRQRIDGNDPWMLLSSRWSMKFNQSLS